MLLHSFLALFIALMQIGSNIAHPYPQDDTVPGDTRLNGADDAKVLDTLVKQLGSLLDQMTVANDAGDGATVLAVSYQMATLIPGINAAVVALGIDAFQVPGSQSPGQIVESLKDVQDGNNTFGGIVFLMKYVWNEPNLVKTFIKVLRDTFVANAARFGQVKDQGSRDPNVA